MVLNLEVDRVRGQDQVGVAEGVRVLFPGGALPVLLRLGELGDDEALLVPGDATGRGHRGERRLSGSRGGPAA
eukprot:15467049-Alexandrium_andersonii.AAC.1